MTERIETVDVKVDVTFTFKNLYDLTTDRWREALAQGTQAFMNMLEDQVNDDIRDGISQQMGLHNIAMNFNRYPATEGNTNEQRKTS